MSQKINVILAWAHWCHFCNDFKPIYDMAKEMYKKSKELDNYDIEFEDYNIADDKIIGIFKLNHFEIKDKITGYPTIFINVKNTEKKNNKKNNQYLQIEHTIINKNDKNNEKQLYEEAAKKFITNISIALKNINSDRVLITQQGGNIKYNESKRNFLNEEQYKKKYLKYKSKYLELKKSVKIN
jgi:thiol-disulfide isomerase/thioredoxin